MANGTIMERAGSFQAAKCTATATPNSARPRISFGDDFLGVGQGMYFVFHILSIPILDSVVKGAT